MEDAFEFCYLQLSVTWWPTSVQVKVVTVAYTMHQKDPIREIGDKSTDQFWYGI